MNYDGATGIEETDCYCLHLSLEICGPELYILEIFKFWKLKFWFFGKRLIQDQSRIQVPVSSFQNADWPSSFVKSALFLSTSVGVFSKILIKL